MYSKAGKATYEIFAVLQHTQDILEPKKLKLPSRFAPKSEPAGDKLADMAAKRFGQKKIMKELDGILDVDDGAEKLESLSKTEASVKEMKKFEPFAQMVSRNDREKVLSYKTVSSNAAYYSPKYHHVEKKELNMVDYSKTSAKRLFDEIISNAQSNSPSHQTSVTLPPISDQIRGKVKGAVSLDFQITRPDILEEARKKKICVTDALANPELPNSLSSIPRLPHINFAKSMPRKDIVIETGGYNCPVYDVNHEFVKPSLGQVGPALDKVSGRKENVSKPYYTIGGTYNYDDYVKTNKSHVYPKVNYPSLQKMPPREKNSESALPAYLQWNNPNINESVLAASKMSPRSLETSRISNSAVYTRT